MNINPVSISPKALEEIKKIMSTKNIDREYGLRIGMRGGGGCGSGMTHMLGFDKRKESDMEYTLGGITVYVEKKHIMYLIGLQIDFYEGSDARGFTFVNPEQKEV